MSWVVDTCVLIDVLEDDPEHGRASAAAVDARAAQGLAVCPVSYVELAPAFGGDRALEDEFLTGVGVDFSAGWSRGDTLAAHAAWHRYVGKRRRDRSAKRPLADLLIGAWAAGRTGLITRNPDDFAPWFPGLELAVP